MICKQFGKKIRKIRRSKNITQSSLGIACGYHGSYIGGIERGERNPTLRVVVKIAKGLSISLDEIFSALQAE